MSGTRSLIRTANGLVGAFIAAIGRMDKSLDIQHTLSRLQRHEWTSSDAIYVFHFAHVGFWFWMMPAPFLLKLAIPAAFTAALLVPFTSQFFFRAIPILAWVLALFSSRYIPATWRPTVSVALLPTLESVLYGANISDILTRYTHPFLDLLAWLPYGLLHFILPEVVAFFLWIYRPKEALHLWSRAFGYMNLCGVWTQILFPCAPPWYEIIYGLTPANYNTTGSAGGLLRVDELFGNQGYKNTFGASPLVFGAMPSLHAACGTLEALFISHFFPSATRYIWTYVAVLFWSTMYLSHHYLIDVVAGACFAVACFHLFMPLELTGNAATAPPDGLGSRSGGRGGRGQYAMYDFDASPRGNGEVLHDAGSEASEDGGDIGYYRSPHVGNASANAGISGGSGANGPNGTGSNAGTKKSHRHTASVASLVREGERVEETWSPIGNAFSLPPTPTRAEMDMEGAGRRR
jgi:membrane-associated phospholipid phosphatase